METLEPILTIPEVAVYLKISKAKIYYLVKRGEIPHIKIGRNVRVRKNDLMIWIEKNLVENKYLQ